MSEIIDMSEIIKSGTEDDKNLRWALCAIMARRDQLLKFWEDNHNPDHPKFLKFEVEMKIDGVEVQFSTVIKLLIDQYEYMCKSAAKEMVEDKIYNMETRFREMLDNLKEEFGINT